MSDEAIIDAINYLCCNDLVDGDLSNRILDHAIQFSGGTDYSETIEEYNV